MAEVSKFPEGKKGERKTTEGKGEGEDEGWKTKEHHVTYFFFLDERPKPWLNDGL